VIDADTAGYLRAACDYVHLNPARAGLVDATREGLDSACFKRLNLLNTILL
jgi:hypothetical protein